MAKSDETSWEGVAEWYDEHLRERADSFQRLVILPNLLRWFVPSSAELAPPGAGLAGQKLADIGCGSGFFAREFAAAGAQVTGCDLSPALIARARAAGSAGTPITYHVAPADRLPFAAGSQDIATIILALQNMSEPAAVLGEARRVLRPGGRLAIVLNHPAFRIPKRSSWGWDETTGVQYRRLDAYLSAARTAIAMHPGAAPDETTVSFHRSLQDYFKALRQAGLAVTRLEEWISPRRSQPGPRAKAEDLARKEFPLFLALEAVVI